MTSSQPRSFLPATGYVVVASALVIAYLVLEPSRTTEWLVVAAPGLAAFAVLASVFVNEPVRPTPWMLLAVGLALLAVSFALLGDELHSGSGHSFPDASTAVGLVALPSFAVAIVGITSNRRNSRDLLAGSEPVISTISLTALVWVGVTGPALADRDLALEPGLWTAVWPALTAVLALIALVRTRASGAGHDVFVVLLFGIVALGAAQGAAGWASTSGRLVPGGPFVASLMVGPLIVGLAATWPSVASLTADRGVQARPQWPQIAGLVIAATLPLAALIVAVAQGGPPTSTVLVASLATAAVTILALARMWRLVGEVRDLSERRGQARLTAMVEHASEVVMLAAPDGRVVYASPGLRATLGYDPDIWPGRYLFDVVVEAERDDALGHYATLLAEGPGSTVEFDATVIHAHGHERQARVITANLIGDPSVDGIVATFRDVTAQRDLERQLSHRAYHDPLTGLANRALFCDRMEHALVVARAPDDPITVIFVDLDDFKDVNDAFGHHVGDQLLKSVAERIRRAAGPGDTPARLGGDEFALLMEDRGGLDRAIQLAESLLADLDRPIELDGHDVAVLASIGISVARDGMTSASLLHEADVAMYEAKRNGKGRIRIFDPSMSREEGRRLEDRNALDRALDLEQLRLVFLPVVDLGSSQVTGAEALLRWAHPEDGDLPAREFMPIAERSGASIVIGDWVLDHALATARHWRPDLELSVNVSPLQLRQPEFVDRALDLIRHHGRDPGTVILEIDEDAVVEEGERMATCFGRLRAAGVRIAIDDFGSGSCSPGHLQRQPVDVVKIDRTLTAGIGSGDDRQSLAFAILGMAAALGLVAAAEGIETADQLVELRRHGCRVGQGHLLSPPLEAHAIVERFAPRTAVASA